MQKDISKIVFNGSVYLITAVFSKGLNILLLPVYTKYLTAAQFGVVSLLLIFQSIVMCVLGLGQIVTIKTTYFEYKREQKDFSGFFSTVIFGTFVLDLLLFVLFALAGEPLFGAFFEGISFFRVGIYVLAASMLLVPYQLYLKLCQTRNESVRYSILEITYMVINSVLSLGFIIFFSMGAEGRVYGLFLSTVAIFIFALFMMRKEMKLHFNRKVYSGTLAIGFPIIFHSMAGFVLNLSDRLFLNKANTLEMVGIYSLAYQIGQAIDMISLSFIEAWSTYFMRFARDSDDKRALISKMSLYYTAMMFALSLAAVLFSKEIVSFLFGPSYHGAEKIIPIIVFGFFIKNIYYLSNQQIIFMNRTKLLLHATGIASIINLALNYVLIIVLHMGMYGAAIATVVSFIVMSLISYIYGQRVFRIHYYMKEMIVIVGLLLAATAFSIWYDEASLSVDIGVKLLVALVCFIVTAAVLPKGELSRFGARFFKKFAKGEVSR